MKTRLNEKNQENLEDKTLNIITERVDDIPLLIGMMIKMGLPEILDKTLPSHWKQRSLSWGWTITIWLSYILSTGDHRKVSMETYVCEMKNTLTRLTGQEVEPLDFSDDRLSHVLTHLSKPKYWDKIETEVNTRSIEVYELPQETVRCDATTVSGYHTVTDTGVMQFGHSKDDPGRPQLKLMTGALDPMGMPLATDTVSGEQADDGLYIPIIERIIASLNKPGLLFVGDCKMSALAIRSYIAGHHHFYLSPLALVGNTASFMSKWIDDGVEKDKQGELEQVFRTNDRGDTVLAAQGYEFERELLDENLDAYKERVLVIHSPNHAQQQARGLEQRLENAQQKIEALTPARGRGKRQITEEEKLAAAIDKILKSHRVADVLEIDYEKQVEQKTKYVGKGRGSKNRKRQTVEKVRYQIIRVRRCEDKIAEQKQRFGWKAFATNVSGERLPLKDAVLSYRNEYRVERIFNRLKSRLNIAPMFVRLDDQIEGMTYLLMLGVRVLTLTEFVIRRSLQADETGLPDLHLENKKKKQKKPTAERILSAFLGITLTVIQDRNTGKQMKHISPLSAVQCEILQRLGLNINIYQLLEN